MLFSESDNNIMGWINFTSQIHVNMLKPFQTKGACHLPPKTPSKMPPEFQPAMCNLIETVSREYFDSLIEKYNGKRHDKTTTSVYSAIGPSDFTSDFSCSLWTNITEEVQSVEVVEDMVLGSKDLAIAIKSVNDSLNKVETCKKECNDAWKDVCGVALALLKKLPKKTVSPTNVTTTTGKTEIVWCVCVCVCVCARVLSSEACGAS